MTTWLDSILTAAEHWIASKVGIVTAFGAIILLAALALTAADVDGLRLGTTFSQRILGLYRAHPWWVIPPLLAWVAFAGLLCGHLTQIPRLNRTFWDLDLMTVLTIVFVLFAWFGSNLWPQPQP